MRNVLLGFVIAAVPCVASAQTLAERMEHVRGRQSESAKEAARSERALKRETASKMATPLREVRVDTSLRAAVEWWSAATGVGLVVNWPAMENEGVLPETPVSLTLDGAPAYQVLSLLVRQAAPANFSDTEFVWDVEPGYVQLLTKRQANRMPVLAVYDVMDLLMEVPNFSDVPEFDLSEVLGGGGGGTGGSGGRGLFGDTQREDRDRPLTKQERGERLAQLVRDSIEPTLWDEHGGTDGHSVRYWNGRLIVRAPKYVQRQIGTPVMTRAIAPAVPRVSARP